MIPALLTALLVLQSTDQGQSQRLFSTAAHATDLESLQTGIRNACGVDFWQFSIEQPTPDQIQVKHSPTLDSAKVNCINGIVRSSRFGVMMPK